MYHIIYNPTSGRDKKKVEKINEIFAYLDSKKVEYKKYETQYYQHPIKIANEITTSNESGNIIVIGGDGTFSEVLNGMINISNWNLGLLPLGSGNDFATCLNLPKKDIKECIDVILKNEPKKVDYILVNDKVVCANVLGTGIDVEVLLNFEKHKKLHGSFRYNVSLVEALLHVKWHKFEVSIDGKEFEKKEGFMVGVCNGCNIGGGIPICPGANPHDGKIEFVYINKVKKIRIPFLLVKLLKGKILTFDIVEHVYCDNVILRDENPLILQIDGNISRDYNEYRCKIIKDGLNIYL